MNFDQFPTDTESLFFALNLQQDALRDVSSLLLTACELADGPQISSEEATVLKANHRDILWTACLEALKVCRETPLRVVEVLANHDRHRQRH
jgi:hypothetical protein